MRDWLREARLKAGKTQKQLAEEIGITESYFSFIEKGTRQKKMDITLVWRLAKALNMDVNKIVALETES